MPSPGYFRFPALSGDTLIFVSEDDLWSVPADGGAARRLTAGMGAASSPAFSPDGATLAFTGREEGHPEVYVMPAAGGPVRRITYLGANSSVLGWTPDGGKILFSSNFRQPFGIGEPYAVSPDGGLPEPLNLGPTASLSLTEGGRAVLGRNNNDPARWKRYRGGTAGELWIDADGTGEYRRLLAELSGNLARPMWVGGRVYFLSDHEGVGNLYSCGPDGSDLRRHTHRTDFYARYPSTDGERIVYHAGADLFLYDPESDTDRRVKVEYLSPRTQRQRKFVDAAKYLESYAPHPKGHSLALTARGKSFSLGNWEGAVFQHGGEVVRPKDAVRYRLTRWLNDGKRVVTVTDRGGDDLLEIHTLRGEDDPVRLEGMDVGRVFAVRISPTADEALLANHRNELLHVDLAAKSVRVIDRSEHRAIGGFDWSPDGRWAAYGFGGTAYTTGLRLWNRETGETHPVTRPVLNDYSPAFDPEGKYLYFLAQRDLNPVYDQLHFDLGFPKGTRPYLLTLRRDLPSPFVPAPHALEDEKDGEKPDAQKEKAGAEGAEKPVPEVTIDLEGIHDRVVPFPVGEGIYGQIEGIEGKVLFTAYPVEGALEEPPSGGAPPSRARWRCTTSRS